MAAEWPKIRLGDYVDTSLGKMLDATKNRGRPKPYLGNSNVRWGSFDLSDLALMKFEEDEDERYGICPGDLIVCEGGEPGRCAIWRGETPDMRIQKALHRIRPKEGLSNYYLFYWLMLSARTGQLEPFFTGTTIKHLTGRALNALELALPPLEEQDAIAHILGSLDDKIALISRMSQTLEAMALAFFKSCFVDFSDVSPKNMQESELGLIPKGWRISRVGEEFFVVGGSTPSTKEAAYWSGGTHHWATPKDLSSLVFPVLLDTERKITDAGLARVPSGLLPVGTLLLSSRAPIGYLAITQVPTAINQGFIAMKSDGVLSEIFMLYWCRENMSAIIGNANGSTFLEISKSNFRPLPMAVPSEEALCAFEQQVRPLHQRIVEGERQSQTLAQLRDTLLPKLISGELRVKDAERLVG